MKKYTSVQTRTDKALVVGSASSLIGFDFDLVRPLIAAGVRVITVNQSGFDCPATDWITHHIDFYAKNLPPVPDLYAPCRECCGTPAGRTPSEKQPLPESGVHYLHARVIPDAEPAGGYGWDDPSFCYEGNSGFHAIQLATKMGARAIGIIGVDARASGYYSADTEDIKDDFTHVPKLAARLKTFLDGRGTRVIYGSPEGRLPWERTTPHDAVRQLLSI